MPSCCSITRNLCEFSVLCEADIRQCLVLVIEYACALCCEDVTKNDNFNEDYLKRKTKLKLKITGKLKRKLNKKW